MDILLVEDNEAVARSMELMLQSKGITAFVTDLGEEALDMARRYQFDAILLDLSLPDMSGFDVLDGLREAGSTLPVLVVTACVTEANRARALAEGADGFLAKPFHHNELFEQLHAITGGVTP